MQMQLIDHNKKFPHTVQLNPKLNVKQNTSNIEEITTLTN